MGEEVWEVVRGLVSEMAAGVGLKGEGGAGERGRALSVGGMLVLRDKVGERVRAMQQEEDALKRMVELLTEREEASDKRLRR